MDKVSIYFRYFRTYIVHQELVKIGIDWKIKFRKTYVHTVTDNV